VQANQAIKAAQQFARTYPQSRRLRLMLAGKMAEQGDVTSAIEELRLMSAEFPEDFDLLFIRAQFAYQIGRLDDANRLLNEYIEVQSQREDSVAAGASDATAALTDAFTLMSNIAEQQGQYDRAVELLGRIDDPTAMYSARLRQAKIRADQGRVDEAIRMIDAAHAADQDEQLIGVLTLTNILRQAQRYDQAIERLKKADSEIRDSVEIKYELGMLLERQNDIHGMERYLRQVIDLDPSYAHAYNALGYSLADRGQRLDEAYELISRAHQILPDDPYIMDSLGWVRYRQGDLKQARSYLEQAFKIRPESEIAAHLGEVLWKLDEPEKARQVWDQGLKINPQDPVLLETMKRFGVGS
jgi:tetratricopeptide (TPR) repeat protein